MMKLMGYTCDGLAHHFTHSRRGFAIGRVDLLLMESAIYVRAGLNSNSEKVLSSTAQGQRSNRF